jgi:hypothetical protein
MPRFDLHRIAMPTISKEASQLGGLGGVYCENCDIAPVKTEGDDGVRPYAVDPAIARRLWAWSERWLR